MHNFSRWFLFSSFLFQLLFLTGLARAENQSSCEKGEQLTLGLPYDIEHLHPWLTPEHERYAVYFTNKPLIYLDEKWQWQCGLCKTLPTKENGLVTELKSQKGTPYLRVTFELREDLQWGDGRDLSGEDFVFSWHLARDLGTSVFDAISNIVIDPKDHKKFYLHFSQNTFFYSRIRQLFVLPKHLEEKIWTSFPGDYDRQSNYRTDSGNPGLYLGPFIPKTRFDKSGITLVRHKNAPKHSADCSQNQTNVPIQEIHINTYPSLGESLNKFPVTANGLIPEFLLQPKEQLPLINLRFAQGPMRPLLGDSLSYEAVTLNLRHPILRNRQVRQALLSGLDREAIYMGIFSDYVVPAVSFVHPRDPLFSANIPFYAFSPQTAAAQLIEADWQETSGGIRKKNSEALAIDLVTTQDWLRPEIAQELKKQWAKIGLQLNVQIISSRDEFIEMINRVDFPGMALHSWEIPAEGVLNGLFSSDSIPSSKNEYSGQNISRWYNNKVDQLLRKIDSHFDQKTRQASKEELQKQYATDLPALPLFFRKQVALIPQNLRGFVITGHHTPSSLWCDQWRL